MDQIAPGIKREWFNDGKIVAYTVSAISTNSIIAWKDTVLTSLEQWPAENRYYLAMHDLSSHGVSMPFLVLTGFEIFSVVLIKTGRVNLERIMANRPDLRIRLALVLSDAMSGKITMSRGRDPNAYSERIETKIFLARDAALEWLRETIP